ncbi:MAG: hypothetical protein ABJH07_12210 [Sedimentitalea sp.]|uniref:hypothetical protein n=1 Tax=Sedimentitalea sp. TaxID=2048915 RepID=UPI00326564D8
MDQRDPTYDGGLAAMLERYNARRKPYNPVAVALPPLDADLDALAAQIVTEVDLNVQVPTRWARKKARIAKEFSGKSQLALLNALLISNLRKYSAPDHAPALFHRLWREQHEHLIEQLDLRWKVSSVMTFADHGGSDVQRQVGQALRMLFSMMKLYEFERLFSGVAPNQPYPVKQRLHTALPLEMEDFSIRKGGLDVNIFAPVWELALTDPVIGPLADHLMQELNRDPANIFRRLKLMRQQFQDKT